ncbi:MAG TPA: hypothetical protein VM431_11470 [Phycisphaerae bacterium]|nr:hypothetical protein [Phycisphaerae bacterium]
MAQNETSQNAEARPQKQPYGPGVLMVIGLFLVIIAAWCAHDYFNPKEEWVKAEQTATIYFQLVGMIVFGAAAVYTLILAAVRSKKGAGGPAASSADSGAEVPPPPPDA